MPLLENGQLFERYRIVKWLGSGVAGESYEAEDRILQRKATLKIIHPWATLPDAARRQFFREMQGISTLNHPYLASMLDYGESEGYMYIARRYVSSGSLLSSNGRLWFQPPLSVASACNYAHQLAQALHYIHQQNIVHGALTFANVLVLRGPNVEQEADYAPFLLADIGLAHFARRFGHPQIEALPVSAAPEQMGKRVLPASDQFALAVLLYFWLAGQPPYLGSPDEVEHLKLTQKITPLSTLNPHITEEQDCIIQRALTAYPEERFPSVLAFTEAMLASLTTPKHTSSTSTKLHAAQPENSRDLRVPTLATSHSSTTPNTFSKLEQTHASTYPQKNQPSACDQLLTEASELDRDITSSPAENVAQGELVRTNQLASPASISVAPMHEATALAQLASMFATDTTETSQASAIACSERDTPAPDGTPKTEAEAEKDETAQLAQQQAQVPRLLISSPYTSKPSEFLLTREATNVGRASANDLLLNDDNLTSRYHALFKRVATRVLVFDKHSNNGVFVNGQRIEAAQDCELADGDHISIGSYELIYRAAQPKRISQLI